MNETTVHRGALPSGTRVEEFEFRQVLGHGGFGITYRGWDAVLQKTVAIKEYMPAGTAIRERDLSVQPQSTEDEKDYEWGLGRFLDEARMLARFDHPGIVRVQRFFEAHGTAYIAMEYLEGRTLASVYEDEKVLGEERLRGLLAPVLDALEQVHAADFLHRDIKPGNVMLRDGGAPVLIDFGAARAALAMRSRNMTAIVTPGFSPIEQYSASGESEQGAWTDIYATGAVLYRGMTGIVPSDATARTMHDRLAPAREAAAGRYGKPLTDAVDWALRMRAADRPQSVAEWREALELGAGRSSPRPSAGRAPAAGKDAGGSGAKRSAGGARLLAALGLAAVLAVGGVAYWWDELAGPVSFPSAETGPAQAEVERAPTARAAEAERLLAECADHGSARRFGAALGCYREVLALAPANEDAAAGVRRFEPLAAWDEVSGRDTVEGYYGYERLHEGSMFARLARRRLKKLEAAYWKEVLGSGTPSAYGRYLEIYPEGRFAGLARRRAGDGH